jgi:hypothetical protein
LFQFFLYICSKLTIMIDNLNIIKSLLDFSDEGDFYYLLILKRKKDQPEGEKDNHQSVRTIKTYCIDSIEYLEKRYDEIKMLCEVFKARAYIHVQKQNHKDVGLNMITEIVTRIQSGQINQKAIFDSVVGQLKTKEKRWIVDIDVKDEQVVENISQIIDSLRPEGTKCEAVIPTKNGWHLITKRFDVMEFDKITSSKGISVDIQRKNPTILFLPDSLHFS